MESNQNLIRANKQPAYSVTKTDGTEHSVGEAGSPTAAIRETKAQETLTIPLSDLAPTLRPQGNGQQAFSKTPGRGTQDGRERQAALRCFDPLDLVGQCSSS